MILYIDRYVFRYIIITTSVPTYITHRLEHLYKKRRLSCSFSIAAKGVPLTKTRGKFIASRNEGSLSSCCINCGLGPTLEKC